MPGCCKRGAPRFARSGDERREEGVCRKAEHLRVRSEQGRTLLRLLAVGIVDRLKTDHRTDRKTARRATGLEMAVEAILKKR
jgi:hypothetical protein